MFNNLPEKEALLLNIYIPTTTSAIKERPNFNKVWSGKKDDYFSGRSMDVLSAGLEKYF